MAKKGSNPKINFHLRPEAQPLDIQELNESQKKAFKEITKKIQMAIDFLDRDAPSDRSEFTKRNPCVFPIYGSNWNPTIFLSGDRGSGKTSLLLSLMVKYQNYHQFNETYRSEKFNSNEISDEYDLPMGRLVWLETIDMEPLPGPTNLLAAILARIEEAVGRFRTEGSYGSAQMTVSSSLEPNPNYQSVIMELNRLQQDVALAWEGNISERAANIDPDTYAVEVLRAERSRLRLNYRVREILDRLADTVFDRVGIVNNPLFILPVDDFDLNPPRCVDLLRLIRMISVPRLLTLILGDIKMVKNVFQLKVRNELSTVGAFAGIVPQTISLDPYSILARRPFSTLCTETASNAVRKLIPPTHVVNLDILNIEDGLEFTPPGQKESIQQLFEAIKVNINIAEPKLGDPDSQYVAGKLIKNLSDFFCMKSVVKENVNENPPFVYCARTYFRLPPRHLNDLWMYLEELADSGNVKREIAGIEFATKVFRETVQEDPRLTPDSVESLLQASDPDFEGNHQFNTENIIVRNYVGPEIDVQLEGRSFVAHQAKDWEIGFQIHVTGQIVSLWLTDPTSAAIVFLHDMLVFRRPRGIVGESLMKRLCKSHFGEEGRKTPFLEWVYAKWDLGAAGIVKVPWYTPPWLSFWQCDILRRGWNDTWFWIRMIEPKLKEVDIVKFNSNYLAYAWIKIGTVIISADSYKSQAEMILPQRRKLEKMISVSAKNLKGSLDKLGFSTKDADKLKAATDSDDYLEDLVTMIPTVKEWLDLVKQLSKLAKRSGHYAVKRELIHGWLVRIACMLAPESGMPSTVASLFFSEQGHDLLRFWMDKSISRQIRRIRAYSAVEFYNRSSYKLLRYLFAPKHLVDILDDENKKNKDDDVNLNWFADRETRRHAINILGYETLCPAIEDILRLSGSDKLTATAETILQKETRFYRKNLADKLGL